MRHVDEGLLHAYLDGAFRSSDAEHARITAHLAACTACRARLEEEQALREEAGRIVGDLGPHRRIVPPWELAVPPAVEVAPRDPQSAARSPRRLVLPLTWAATLLLALGIGWLTPELWRDGAPMAHSPEAAGSPAGVAAAPMKRAEDAANAGEQDHAAPSPTTNPVQQTVSSEPAPAAVGAAAPRRPAEAEAGSPPVPFVAPRLAAAEGPPLPQLPAGHPVTSITPRPPHLASAVLPRAEDTAPPADERRRRSHEAPAAERTAAVPLPDLPRGERRREPRGPASRSGARSPVRLPPRAAPPSTLPGGERRTHAPAPRPSWSLVSEAEALRRLGAPLARVQGLPLSGLWIAAEDSSWRVRTVQETEAGTVLELLQWRQPSGADQSAADEAAANAPAAQLESGEPRVLQGGDAGDGRSTVLLALPSGRSLLSLSAPLPLDSLLSLVPRVKELKP